MHQCLQLKCVSIEWPAPNSMRQFKFWYHLMLNQCQMVLYARNEAQHHQSIWIARALFYNIGFQLKRNIRLCVCEEIVSINCDWDGYIKNKVNASKPTDSFLNIWLRVSFHMIDLDKYGLWHSHKSISCIQWICTAGQNFRANLITFMIDLVWHFGIDVWWNLSPSINLTVHSKTYMQFSQSHSKIRSKP